MKLDDALFLPADPERDAVAEVLRSLDPDGLVSGQVLRDTFDQLYDGARTSRYRWDQLFKTEKTHFGTLIEINLQREFQFDDGAVLDYRIAGLEVDAKYSQRDGGWMIPPEAVGQLLLVINASDALSRFSIGVVRANPDLLNGGRNRDAKNTLSKAGRETIDWVHYWAELPPNSLLHLPNDDVDEILELTGGTARIIELFRRSAGRLVGRASIATVASQLDFTRRVRGGQSGARDPLADEGIVVLSGTYDWQREAARELGLPSPRRSEYVSGYVAPAPPEWDGLVAIGPSGGRLMAASETTRQAFDRRWYQ